MRFDLPTTISGWPLNDELRARFERLVQVIYDFDPMRPPTATVQLAQEALLATVRLTETGWVSLRRYTLSRGAGPSIVLR